MILNLSRLQNITAFHEASGTMKHRMKENLNATIIPYQQV